MKLWLDDVRPAPEGHVVAKTANAALGLLKMADGKITEASLDHDLGHKTMNGHWLLRVAAQHGLKLPDTIHIHSMNPVGVMRMSQELERMGYTHDPADPRTFNKIVEQEQQTIENPAVLKMDARLLDSAR